VAIELHFLLRNRERKIEPEGGTEMQRLTLNLTIAAAALTVAAATASAQSLKAEVPFAFQSGATRMQPGSYNVRVIPMAGGQGAVRLQNVDNRTSYIKMPSYLGDTPATWQAAGHAVIEFACSDGNCALARIWTGDGTTMSFAVPKAKNGERVASILVRADRTE
jgi:hypothetical protein